MGTNTTTTTGLKVKARLDRRHYPAGIKVTKATMSTLRIRRQDFHGEWNYEITRREEP